MELRRGLLLCSVDPRVFGTGDGDGFRVQNIEEAGRTVVVYHSISPQRLQQMPSLSSVQKVLFKLCLVSLFRVPLFKLQDRASTFHFRRPEPPSDHAASHCILLSQKKPPVNQPSYLLYILTTALTVPVLPLSAIKGFSWDAYYTCWFGRKGCLS